MRPMKTQEAEAELSSRFTVSLMSSVQKNHRLVYNQDAEVAFLVEGEEKPATFLVHKEVASYTSPVVVVAFKGKGFTKC